MALTMPNRAPTTPMMDWLLVACLVGLIVAARLVPHAPNFTPVVAAGLFAGMVLRSRTLALLVPVTAMVFSDLIMGFEDWRIRVVIYAALVLPVILGIWGQRFRPVLALLPLALTSSLLFFVVSNFAVWVFSGMYTFDLAGLVQCYVLALPFLQNTMMGDVIWTAALFGSWWLVQRFWFPATQRSPSPVSPR